jgi:hypothetical protein
MPTDLRAAIASLLPDGDDRLGDAVREAVRPIIHDAFRQGLEIGFGLARDTAMNGFEEAARSIKAAFEPTQTRLTERRERKPQVPRGTIGPLIDSVLTDSPGSRAAEIEAKAVARDPKITPASVGNELRRYRDRRYRRDDATMRWYLIGDTEKEKAEVGSFANGAGSWVGGTDQAVA